jgi:uncharacterized protein YqgV (UPF0045/DUF77 family)
VHVDPAGHDQAAGGVLDRLAGDRLEGADGDHPAVGTGADIGRALPKSVHDRPPSNQHGAQYCPNVALRLEYTVEPFVEGAPGPHVRAALDAAAEAGLDVEFGPFGTTVAGADDDVLAVTERILGAAMRAGASRVSLQVIRS